MDAEDPIQPAFSSSPLPPDQPSTSGSRQWSSSLKPPQDIPFTGVPNVNIPLTQKEPINIFNTIASDELCEMIVKNTNHYAIEVLSRSVGDKSRITRWKDLTVREFRTFLGLVFHTGTIQTNRLNDYWNRHHLFNLSTFSQYMSRDRFLLILRVLHFNNNDEESTRIGKIQPLIVFFQQ